MGSIDDVAGAVADRIEVSWPAAGTETNQDALVLEELRAISQIGPADASENLVSVLRRRLPLLAEAVKWLSLLQVAVGGLGTVVALRRLSVPRLPFVLAVLLTFAATALVLDAAGRDRRARLLGFVYWMIAAAYSASGVAYLARSSPGLVWLTPLALVRPEAFLSAGLWLFVRDFPRAKVRGWLDRLCSWAALACAVLGGVVCVATAAGRLSMPWFQTATLVMALPAVVILLARWRTTAGAEATRVRWFLLAVLLAIAPPAAFAAADVVSEKLAAFFRSPEGLSSVVGLTYLPLLALPLLTGYAVAATNVLPVRVALHAGVRYLLAKHVPLWIAALALGLVAVRLFLSRHRALVDAFEEPGMRTALWLALAATMLVVFRPVLLRLVDAWRPSKQEGHSIALARLTDQLRTARTPFEVADVLAQGVEHALGARTDPYLMRAGRLAPVGRNGLAPPVGTWVPILLQAREPCVVGEGLSQSVFEFLHAEDQDWIVRGGIAGLAPVSVMRGSADVLGMLTIERRRDALDFSAGDREFLGACTAAAGLACEALRPTDAADASLSDVALQCVGCGLVEAWESGEGNCPCGGKREAAVLPKWLAGRFEITRWIGSGGMGVVYRAVDINLRRDVAVKTLTWLTPDAAQRALDEASAMANLPHANVAIVYGSESWQGTPVLVMEYLAGGTLADTLRRGPIDYRRAVSVASQVATALEHLHGAGHYHGDIKPSNIGFTVDGVPKLLDFGLSGRMNVPRRDERVGPMSDREDDEPRPIWGTPAYVSPAVWRGAAPSPSLDLWALSVVMFEMIAGRHPYGSLRDEHAIARRVALAIEELRATVPVALCIFLNEALSGAQSPQAASAPAFRESLLRTLQSSTP